MSFEEALVLAQPKAVPSKTGRPTADFWRAVPANPTSVHRHWTFFAARSANGSSRREGSFAAYPPCAARQGVRGSGLSSALLAPQQGFLFVLVVKQRVVDAHLSIGRAVVR
jgi:hypothetical protein